MNRRVVVTGGAVVSSLGFDDEEVWRELKKCRNKVKYMKEWEGIEGLRPRVACPVEVPLLPFSRKVTRSMGRVALLALNATESALGKAGLLSSDILRSGRTGVSYGSSAGDVDSLVDFYGLVANGNAKSITGTTYIKAMPQTCAANLSVHYGLKGRLITTNTACTSGSMAIGYAYEAIKEGKADVMIAGGAEALTPCDSAVFDSLFSASTMNESPEKTPRAYDKDRDGLVIGEGAGTLILEEYESAKRRGATILSEIVGFATNTDGVHITHPNQETQEEVMRMALDCAGLKSSDIGYVNAHGTATISGDVVESNATYNVFSSKTPVSTLKSYIGHTLGACGAIEAYISIMMMRGGWFAPNLNLDSLDPECAPLDYITGGGRAFDATYVMSNNFAFGGINTSLVFKKI